MSTDAKVRRILRIEEGDEEVIDGYIWFRISGEELKVHPADEEIDGPGTMFVQATPADVRDFFEIEASS